MDNLHTKSGLFVESFDKMVDNKQVGLYILTNRAGSEIAVTNYGAKIVSLLVPDKNGKLIDVVLGHSTIEEYLSSEEPYFGAVCGRVANRIAKGNFMLNGNHYRLAINNGPNTLHGGIKGFNAIVWDVKNVSDSSIELYYLSPDGEEGYPGNLEVTVTYTLTEDNALEIEYKATTDFDTIINLTNHSYFNLSGAGDLYIGDHLLTIHANTYLPTDETAIPYGKPEEVKGTPMDFRTPYEIGARIDNDFQQLHFGKGYDHTYILNKQENELSLCAEVTSPKTGIMMKVYTTEPGVQLYTGNWMTGNFVAKEGKHYPMRSAFCLETQHYPDSINRPEYPTVILRGGEQFESKTIFEFNK
ncbi:MAG: galactose mutarotase [Dysgonamonadaceae bacterium]|jgi:aldose 1-epimerase|nr:galactose mutarotase [Dysgonamonadaceae bacterium]